MNLRFKTPEIKMQDECHEIICEILSMNDHPNLNKLESIIPNISSFYSDADIFDEPIYSYLKTAPYGDLRKILTLKKVEVFAPRIVFSNPERPIQKICGGEYRRRALELDRQESERLKKKKEERIKFANCEPENPYNIF